MNSQHKSSSIISGRTKIVLDSLLERKQNNLLKLKEASKSILSTKAEELIADIHEAKLILDEKDQKNPDKRQALFTDKNNKIMIDILTFLGPRISITDQNPITLLNPNYPLIQKTNSDFKTTFTLHCPNYSKDPVVIVSIALNEQSSIDFCKKLFLNYTSGTCPLLTLSASDRFNLLKDAKISVSKKEYDSFYKFNSLLYGIGLIYFIEKNNCQLSDLLITKNEALKNFKALLEIKQSSGILLEKNQLNYFEYSSKKGIHASQLFTYIHRMSVRVTNRKIIYPSPKEILSGVNDKILFSELSKKNTINSNSLKKSIKQCLERNYAARPFEPFAAKNIIAYIRKITPENKITEVLDFCGGWGERLVAFLADSNIKKISINDANSKMIPAYENIVKEYNHTNKEVELTCNPFEKYPEDKIIEKFNRYDLIMTSPPYFNKELYEGKESSHKLYSTYSTWGNGFLAKSIENAYRMTNPQGYIVLCVANIRTDENHFAMIVDNTHSEMQRYCSHVSRILYTHPNFARSKTSETFVVGKVQKNLPCLRNPSIFQTVSIVDFKNHETPPKKNKPIKFSQEENISFEQFQKLLTNNFINCQFMYNKLYRTSFVTLFSQSELKFAFKLLQEIFGFKSTSDLINVLNTGRLPTSQAPILLNLTKLPYSIMEYRNGLLIFKKLLAFILVTPVGNEQNHITVKQLIPNIHFQASKRKAPTTVKENLKKKRQKQSKVTHSTSPESTPDDFSLEVHQDYINTLPKFKMHDVFDPFDSFEKRVDALTDNTTAADVTIDTFFEFAPTNDFLESSSTLSEFKMYNVFSQDSSEGFAERVDALPDSTTAPDVAKNTSFEFAPINDFLESNSTSSEFKIYNVFSQDSSEDFAERVDALPNSTTAPDVAKDTSFEFAPINDFLESGSTSSEFKMYDVFSQDSSEGFAERVDALLRVDDLSFTRIPSRTISPLRQNSIFVLPQNYSTQPYSEIFSSVVKK